MIRSPEDEAAIEAAVEQMLGQWNRDLARKPKASEEQRDQDDWREEWNLGSAVNP